MTYGMTLNLNQGDLVFAPLSFSDWSGYKNRPALVLACFGEDALLCPLTSNLAARKQSVLVSDANLLFGRLATTSRIKVHSLSTIHRSLVSKPFAHLHPELFDRVRDEFRALV